MPGAVKDLHMFAVADQAAAVPISDPRIERAKPDAGRFAFLVVQLALLLVVFRVFHVEGFGGISAALPQNFDFFLLSCLVFGTFAIHYWLPFGVKDRFWITISVLALLVLGLRAALAILAAGLGFYFVLASRLTYAKRVALVVAGFAAVIVTARHPGFTKNMLGPFWLPDYFWPVFGTMFLFRMVVYIYNLHHLKGRPPLKEYLAYFFILPNYYFWDFPIIDYKTMQLSYYKRNVHEVAQQGIGWIFRGTLQLLIYRIVCDYRDILLADGVRSPVSVLGLLLLTVLTYLKISGSFHISVGMLHLFGYDLPETNHKYLLARSFIDFWRRVNVYWRDCMFNVVFLPLYFRLRKSGEMRAKMLATAAVFLVSWAMHYYHLLWQPGQFQLLSHQMIFWGTFGALVMVNMWWESRRPRPRVMPAWKTRLQTGASVAGTLAVIIPLWSLLLSPSLSTWFGWITWWKQGF